MLSSPQLTAESSIIVYHVLSSYRRNPKVQKGPETPTKHSAVTEARAGEMKSAEEYFQHDPWTELPTASGEGNPVKQTATHIVVPNPGEGLGHRTGLQIQFKSHAVQA